MEGDITKRLPVEMLARIFHAWKDTSWWKEEHGLRAEWVRTTCVCKRWREVALHTPALWSSVLVTGQPADIRALEAQLDRARHTPLDLLVLSRGVAIKGLKAALKLVLCKKKQVENLKIVYDIEQDTVVEGFVKGVSAKLDSLLLRPNEYLHPDDEGWEFTPIDFPRLSKLDVKAIIPVRAAPMLNLTHLFLKNSVDDLSTDAETPWRRVHSFLEACPNLEYLEVTYDFGYPTIRRDPQCLYRGLPVVTLPKLRALSLDWLALDISTALATLRLPALSSFHILGDCGLDNPEDADFFVIPQNISAVLPELRRTRSLSLVVPVDSHCEDLCLEGTSRDPAGSTGTTHRDGGARRTAEDYWSVTLPNLESLTEEFRGSPCCIWYNTARFLARIPHVVDPANLTSLELHIANGLPVTRDWAQFFGGMVHLERLEIGGATLIRNVLEAFEIAAESSGGPVLCAELQEVALCFGLAKKIRRVDNRGRLLSELVPRTIGTWVRARASALKLLTVLMRAGASAEGGSGVQSGSSSSSDDEDDGEDQPALSHDARSTQSTEPGAALRLWRDLEAALKPGGSIEEVVLAEKCCGACDEVYETVGADEFGTGELREGVAYY